MLCGRCSGLVLSLGMVLSAGCGDKDDADSATNTEDAALCTPSDLSDPDCESASAVLRLSVTVGGQPAGSGLTVTATNCDGVAETATTDDYGEVRMTLPATTYLLSAEDPASETVSEPETHDLPGCQTTTLELAL